MYYSRSGPAFLLLLDFSPRSEGGASVPTSAKLQGMCSPQRQLQAEYTRGHCMKESS